MKTIRVINNHIGVYLVLLAILESLIFFTAVLFGMAVRADASLVNPSEVINNLANPVFRALMFSGINMAGMTAIGLYQVDQFRGRNGFTPTLASILISMFLVSIVLMVLYYSFPATRLGRGVMVVSLVSSLFAIVLVRRFAFAYFRQDRFVSRVIIFGVGRNAARLINTDSAEQKHASYKIVGVCSSPEQTRVVPEHMIFESGYSLIEQTRILRANEIVIALDDRSESYPVQQILDCKLAGIKISDPLTFLEREHCRVDLSHLNPSWMVFSNGYKGSKLKSLSSRTFDVITSLALLIVTAPILLIVSLLIALEGNLKESILHRQKRVGKNGKCFDLLKFRSIRIDAEANGAQLTEQGDLQVTRLGRAIRTLRIDNLPQLFNVLRGEMRLVGPTPEQPESVEKLSQNIDFYQQRHSIKPGLTGWAQLKYPYGATEKDAYVKLQYDLYYIKNANTAMDFFILLRALQTILFRQGVR